jgi:hypothetical protein
MTQKYFAVALPQPHQHQSNHQASTPVTTTTGQKGRGSRGAAVPKNVPSSMASTLNATTATKNQQQQQQRKTSSPLLTTATNAAEKQKKAERVNSIFNKSFLSLIFCKFFTLLFQAFDQSSRSSIGNSHHHFMPKQSAQTRIGGGQ